MTEDDDCANDNYTVDFDFMENYHRARILVWNAMSEETDMVSFIAQAVGVGRSSATIWTPDEQRLVSMLAGPNGRTVLQAILIRLGLK